MAVTAYSLGAAEEVTGSRHILEIDGRSIMIDCGAFQGKRAVADEKNRNFEIPVDRIETVILTHAHYDHCGLLPLLAKKGFDGNIYATPATRDLADLVMMEYVPIYRKLGREKFLNWLQDESLDYSVEAAYDYVGLKCPKMYLSNNRKKKR